MPNSKSFNLYRKVAKSFTLLVSGFSVSNTFLFLCKIPFKITANARLAYKFVSTMTLGRNRLTINKFSMNQKETMTASIRPPMLTLIVKLSEKWLASLIGTSGSIKIPMTIVAATRATERWLNNTISLDRIKLGQNVIEFVLTIATYTRLSTLDIQTLNDLDVQTLNDLDYVVT